MLHVSDIQLLSVEIKNYVHPNLQTYARFFAIFLVYSGSRHWKFKKRKSALYTRMMRKLR